MKIHLSPPDPAWPLLYQQEEQRLVSVFGPLALQVEHIGSTAIPGLAAKAVIDIQVGVPDLYQFDTSHGPALLQRIGYTYLPAYENWMPFRRFFHRDTGDVRMVNLHLVAADHPWWRRHILFRDYLRANPDARDRYARAKQELASRDWPDVNDYAGAKTDIVLQLEEEAFAHFHLTADEAAWVRTSRV